MNGRGFFSGADLVVAAVGAVIRGSRAEIAGPLGGDVIVVRLCHLASITIVWRSPRRGAQLTVTGGDVYCYRPRPPLPCAAAIGQGRLRHREHGPNAIGIADIEQDAFGKPRPASCAAPRLTTNFYDKERLPPLDFAGVGALPLEAGDNSARLITKIHA